MPRWGARSSHIRPTRRAPHPRRRTLRAPTSGLAGLDGDRDTMGRNPPPHASRARRLPNSPVLRHRPQTGPAEHRTGHAAAPGTPLNRGIVDHMARTVHEVADLTRQINPQAGPIPKEVADI